MTITRSSTADRAARPRRSAALALAAAALLGAAGAPSAVAQSPACQGAPGSSAVEQYCEAIPSGDGGRTQSGSGKSGGPSTISKKTGQALAKAGADGASVARLAQDGSAPASGSKAKSAKGSGSGDDGEVHVKDARATGVAAPVDATGTPLHAATEAAQSGSTVGPALAWGIVGMSALGAISAVLLRRRRGTIAPPGDDE